MKILRECLFVRKDRYLYEKTCECGCRFQFSLNELNHINKGVNNDYVGFIYCPKCGRRNTIHRKDGYNV